MALNFPRRIDVLEDFELGRHRVFLGPLGHRLTQLGAAHILWPLQDLDEARHEGALADARPAPDHADAARRPAAEVDEVGDLLLAALEGLGQLLDAGGEVLRRLLAPFLDGEALEELGVEGLVPVVQGEFVVEEVGGVLLEVVVEEEAVVFLPDEQRMEGDRAVAVAEEGLLGLQAAGLDGHRCRAPGYVGLGPAHPTTTTRGP